MDDIGGGCIPIFKITAGKCYNLFSVSIIRAKRKNSTVQWLNYWKPFYTFISKIDYLMKNSMRQKCTSPTCLGHLAQAGKVSRCYHPEKVGYTLNSWPKTPNYKSIITFVIRWEMVFRLLLRVKRLDSRLDVDSRSQSQSSCNFSLKSRRHRIGNLAYWYLLYDPLIRILSSFVINTVCCGLR